MAIQEGKLLNHKLMTVIFLAGVFCAVFILPVMAMPSQTQPVASLASARFLPSAAPVALTATAVASATGPGDPSLLGMALEGFDNKFGLTQTLALKAYWGRRWQHVSWQEVEPLEGQYNWTVLADLEQELLTAQANGLEPILEIQMTPRWAQKFEPFACGPIRADKFEAFAEFMEELVTRYGASTPYGVRYWQLGNEPDVAPAEAWPDSPFGCWGDPTDPYFGGGHYGQMLKVVYPRLKAADPQAQVLMAGLLLQCDPYVNAPTPDCTNGNRFKSGLFLEGVLREGGGDYFDIVDVHSYGQLRLDLPAKMHSFYNWSGAQGGTGLPEKVAFVRGVLARYGHHQKPLMVGELALKCDTPAPECYEVGAAFIPRAYAEAYSLNVLGATYYALISEFGYKGLLLPDFSPKPAYYAYQFMSEQIATSQYEGPLTIYPDVAGQVFNQAGQRQIQIIWSTDGLSKTVPLASNFAGAYDKLGVPLSTAGPLVVDWSPIYLVTESISTTLTGLSAKTLVYTDTQGAPTRFDFPTGVVSQTTRLAFRPTFTPTQSSQAFARHAFELKPYQNGLPQSHLTFDKAVKITLQYTTADIATVSDESKLALYWWNGTRWIDAAKTCSPDSTYSRDLSANTLSLPVCTSGWFALFGPTNRSELPLILSSYQFDNDLQLTNPATNNFQPALSPDNRTVVFLSDRLGQIDIFSLLIETDHLTNLSETAAAQEDTPIFTPDGQSIVFASDRGGDWGIYSMQLDGQNVQPLVDEPGSDEIHPTLTADSLTIGFSSNRQSGNWDIFTARLDDHQVTPAEWARLTTAAAADRFPVLAADGRQLLFRSERDGNSEIYLMQADGSNQRRLIGHPAFETYPLFTADASGLIFVSDRESRLNTYLVNRAGESLKSLETRPYQQMHTPRLSVDGQKIVYAGGLLNGNLSIYVGNFTSPLLAVGRQGFLNLAGNCDWEGGVLALGWSYAWQATGDPQYFDWTQQWVDSCLPVSPGHVNDGLLGYAALIAYRESGQPHYLVAAQGIADYILSAAGRAADGTLFHTPDLVWDDTLISIVPFLLELSRVTNNPVYAEEAIQQVLNHAEHLQDPATGLYRHAWRASNNTWAGPSFWARGNSWMIMTSAELLGAIEPDHPAYAEVLKIFQQQAAGLVATQDQSGLWPTVVNRPDFYLETSASALIGYGLYRGVAAGWLDSKNYTPAIEAALRGIWRRVPAEGTVTGVSGPTGPMLVESDYNAIPADQLELYGQGAVLILSPALPAVNF